MSDHASPNHSFRKDDGPLVETMRGLKENSPKIKLLGDRSSPKKRRLFLDLDANIDLLD